MKLEKRIIAFIRLGETLRELVSVPADNPILKAAVTKASKHNGWFTEENILLAIGSLGEMLREDKIREWVSKYQVPSPKFQIPRNVGVIMAGNIPLVGFHDFLCVLMSGNIFLGKLSSEDEFLLPAMSKLLIEIEHGFKDKIHFALPLTPLSLRRGEAACTAFIATGSNNSARYFEYYFGKYPHIIRRNRNAIAILDGAESEDDLKNLGKDIFQYFGLGCRNVSKIYIPEKYNLDKFFSAIVNFGDVIEHNKYYNNYLYYRTIYLLNREKFLDNNFLMLKEDDRIASPVATLYYERYKNKEELFQKLEEQKENIQCVVASSPTLLLKEKGVECIGFGKTQSPELRDYADGVDTMGFLLRITN